MQPIKQMHLELLNLTLICTIKQGGEWEGVFSARRVLAHVRMTNRVSQTRQSSIYRALKKL